jgi:hypothetical protein
MNWLAGMNKITNGTLKVNNKSGAVMDELDDWGARKCCMPLQATPARRTAEDAAVHPLQVESAIGTSRALQVLQKGTVFCCFDFTARTQVCTTSRLFRFVAVASFMLFHCSTDATVRHDCCWVCFGLFSVVASLAAPPQVCVMRCSFTLT